MRRLGIPAQRQGKYDWAKIQAYYDEGHSVGIKDDNRLENLEFLCPNCHSQTDNFAGRNRPLRVVPAPDEPEEVA